MKRILSLLLAVVLVGGLAGSAFADSTGAYSIGYSGSGSTQLSADTLGVVHPGQKVTYNIYKDGAHAVRSDIRTDKIAVKTQIGEGSKALGNVAVKYNSAGYAYVELEFADPYVSVDELDFSVTLYLTQDKSRMTGTELSLYGSLENYEQTAGSNSDYVNLTDTPVVEATAYIREIELDLGDGLSLFTRMYEGRRYYGSADQDISSADYYVMDQYPAIDTVYYLRTIGLSTTGNYALFDVDGTLYVYNSNLEYLGTTNDKLAYSSKYYLATSPLDVQGDDAIDSIPTDSSTDNAASGGDEAPENVNRNPGTGEG